MDQLSFASLDFAAKKKRTKRDVFLAEMFRGRGNAGTNSPPNAERSS